MESACSEGRRLLLAVLQTTSQADVAARVSKHVTRTRQAVTRWASWDASERATPDYRSRLALEAEYKIPMRSWEEAASGPIPQARDSCAELVAGPASGVVDIGPDSRPPPARDRAA